MDKLLQMKRGGILVDVYPVEAVKIVTAVEDRPICHVRQRTVSKYPRKRFNNSLSTGLFQDDENVPYDEYETVRNTIFRIPESLQENTEENIAAIQKRLNSRKGFIQRIVTHNINDVMSDGDRYILENSDFPYTKEQFMDKYETQDKEGNRYSRQQLRAKMKDDGTLEVVNPALPREFSRRLYQDHYVPDVDKREGEVEGSATVPGQDEWDAELLEAERKSVGAKDQNITT